jgi:hypothetical protein
MKDKSRLLGRGRVLYSGVLALCAALWVTGCDDVGDNDFDHDPPAGKGAVIVDNISPTDINVYVDGRSVGQVDDDDDRPFDLSPGVHRVVLDEDDGSRRWSADIDVLAGRLTILRVTLDTGDRDDYNVDVDFD